MFGCIRKLGCLVILAVGVGAWLLWSRNRTPDSAPRTTTTATSRRAGWEPLSASGAENGRKSVESLSRGSGQVFATLSPGEAASYIFLAATRMLPSSAQNAAAKIEGDEILVRATIALKEFGGAKALGPLGQFLGDRDTVQLAGKLKVVQSGLAEFQVRQIKLGSLSVPAPLIPRLLNQFRKGDRPPMISDRGLPMPIPEYIADIRIADGRVTLYKITQ